MISNHYISSGEQGSSLHHSATLGLDEIETAPGRPLLRPPTENRHQIRRLLGYVLPPAIAIVALGGLWHLGVAATDVEPQVLPSPARVFKMGWRFRSDLWANTVPTLVETVVGIGVTIAVASAFSIAMDFSAWVRRLIYPMLVASQTIPIIVLAPLMVIWFGFGLFPKIIIIIMVSFFPISVALTDGFNATPPEFTSLLRSMGASRWQEFLKVRLPTALPYFFTGLRISITWSVVAAIFGEYVGAAKGLGIFMQVSKNNYRVDLVLAAVIVTTVVSLLLFALAFLIQRLTIPWYSRMQRAGGHQQ